MDLSESRRSHPAFGGQMASTSSMMGQQQQSSTANMNIGGANNGNANNAAYDPNDYIEITQPDSIFLSQWSCVPIRCTLAADDRKAGGPATPVPNRGGYGNERYSPYTCEYIVPRQSYFFMHFETILESFKNVVGKEGFPWLSYRINESTILPLPWQYPVGVVIDMIRMRRRVSGGYSSATINAGYEERVYPFEITLHLSEPKVSSASDPAYISYLKTLRIKDAKGGLLFLRQLMKRSTCYAYGSTIPMLELELNHPDYYTDLFEGIQENDPEKYWRGRCGLRYYGEVEREDEAIEGSIINVIPVGGGAATLQATMGSPQPSANPTFADHHAGDGPASASAAAGAAGAGAGPSSGAAAAYIRQQLQAYPIVLHCEGTSKLIRWRQNGQKLGQFLKEHVPWLEFLTREDIFHRHEPAHFVLIQGLSPFLSSPMEDLYELLASTDLFLHIVVRPMFVAVEQK